MPRTKPAVERRADLLAAAEALFVTRGVAATTTEDITKQAGVSKGLFYLYFRSKEDLLAALQERFVTAFAESVRAAAAAQSDWPARLDACVRACFEHFRAQDRLHEVLFRHPTSPPEHHPPLVDAIRSVLADGVAAGAFRLDDVESTALLLHSAMHAFDPTFREYDRLPDGRLLQATQQLARRAVGLPSADEDGR